MHGTTTLERPDRQAIAFEVARTKYEQARAEYDRLWAIHSAAEEADDQDCPRIDVFFDEYNLGIGMSRGRALDSIRYCLAKRQGVAGLVLFPPEARKACEEKSEAIGKEAEQIADEFMAYQARYKESRERHRIDELSRQAFVYGEEHYFPAREALMALPASDTEGLLLKMEVAATWTDEPFVDSVFADIRRVLAA